MSKVPDIKVTFCMASFNRLEESMIQIRRTCPHVDRTIVIDGGSWDGSIEFFNSQECKDLGVECYVHPWVDDPPGQRNKYLDLIDDGWVLVLDCDELLQIPALYKLKFLAKEAEDKGCDGIAFRAHDIQFDPEGGIYDSLSNYYNRIFFKSIKGMRYMGHTHVALFRPGLRDRCMKTDLEYYHIKPWQDVFFRGCRNYWTTSGVAANTTNDSSWQEFKKLTKESGFDYFYQFAEYLKKGNIDPKFKQWFIDHKDDENPEARSWFASYFVFLHPHENTAKLSNKDLEYKEDRKPVRLMA
jgi:glycosyltransferase involved in cell wall biosynthesis